MKRAAGRGHPGSSARELATLLGNDRLRYGKFVDDGEIIDDVVVSRISTDEPIAIDISAHGGVRIIERLLRSLERLGAPLDEGHDRRDLVWQTRTLIESEALSLLHLARTERAVRFLSWQRQHLAECIRKLGPASHFSVAGAAETLTAMIAGYEAAQVLIHGAKLVLLGPPNSGKSTLFNRLLARPATVVSSRPGTTRDWVSCLMELQGAPVTLIDTAGHRPSVDDIQRVAIERGRAIAGTADLHLIVLDASRAGERAARMWREKCHSSARELLIFNKMDLVPGSIAADGESYRGVPLEDVVCVSARTGTGTKELTGRIAKKLGLDEPIDARPCLFTERQRGAAEGIVSDLAARPGGATAGLTRGLIGEWPHDPGE